WAGHAKLCRTICERGQKAEIIRQPQRCHWKFAADNAVIEVVVELLGSVIRLDARQTLREVVDHVIAAQFSISNDVETANFLVLDSGFHGSIVNLIEFVAADPPSKIFGL